MTGGGDGGGASCGAVAACGGDVVGRWNITDQCVTAEIDVSSVCAGITASVVFSFAGSATYNANLTYTQTGSNGGTVVYHFPRSCIATATCAQVQASLMSSTSGAAMGMTFQSGTCTAEGTGCVCNMVLASGSAEETGTYSTSGGTLATTHNGTVDENLYCVNGTTMHQMLPASAQVTGAIILTKQ